MITENHAYCILVGCTCVLETEWHHHVIVYPNGVHNDICFSSSRYILIWLYPEKPSIKDILLKPHVLSIIMSVICNENSSLEQVKVSADSDLVVLFKNMHNVSNPVWVLSLLNEATFNEFVNFDFIAAIMWGQNCHHCCLTGSVSGLMLRWCIAT